MREETIPFSAVQELLLDESRPVQSRDAIEMAVRTINYSDEQIRLGAQRIKNISETVLRNLNQGASLNELGEYQGAASEIDRHIALRHQAWQILALLIGPETARLATRRFVQHLSEAHNIKAPLDPGDIGNLRAQHQIAMNQNPSEVHAECDKFI